MFWNPDRRDGVAVAHLVERDAELAVMEAAIRSACAGNGGVVVVHGPPGIGKTALATRLADSGASAGMDVLVAHGHGAEAGVAYGVVRQLLAHRVAACSLPERAALLQGAAAWCTGVLGLDSHGVALEDATHRLGLYWLCSALAERAPLMLVVDDAQWADPPSLRFLEYLAPRLADLPVLLAVLAREVLVPAGFTGLSLAPSARILTPAPLSQSAVATLARWHGKEPEANQVAHWRRITGGNPLLVSEVIVSGATPNPRITDWVRSQLALLSAPASALVEVCAVLDDGTPIGLVAELTNSTRESCLREADALRAAGLVDGIAPVRFRHPLVREAVAESLPRERSVRLHREAARYLANNEAFPGAIAHHLMPTPPLGEPDTVRLLTRAARDALQHGDPRTARQWIGRALDEPPTPSQLTGVLLLDGQAARMVGDYDAAAASLRRVLARETRIESRAAALRGLVHALFAGGGFADAAAEIEAQLEDLSHCDRETAIAVEADILSAARHSVTDRVWSADRLRRWHGRLTGDSAAERLLLANLSTQVALDGGSAADAARLAELAAAGGTLVHEQTADAMAAYQTVWVLCGAGRLTVAEAVLDAADLDVTRRGSVSGFVLSTLFRSYIEFTRGNLSVAEASVATAYEVCGSLPDQYFAAPAVAAAVLDVLRERGGHAEAEDVAARYGRADTLPDSTPYRLLLHSRGLFRLATGRVEEALEDLRELDQREHNCHVLATHLTAPHTALAHALAAAGATSEAQAQSERAVADAAAWDAPRFLGHALRARAASLQPAAAVDVLRAAVDAHGDEASELDRGWVHHDLGVAHARLGRRADASTALHAALDHAHRCGGRHLASQARVRLVELGFRPRRAASTGIEALTGSQRRVAELAARGWSNREIAQSLFITTRTVEVHLTAAYRKLGVTTRKQLPTVLPAGPDEACSPR